MVFDYLPFNLVEDNQMDNEKEFDEEKFVLDFTKKTEELVNNVVDSKLTKLQDVIDKKFTELKTELAASKNMAMDKDKIAEIVEEKYNSVKDTIEKEALEKAAIFDSLKEFTKIDLSKSYLDVCKVVGDELKIDVSDATDNLTAKIYCKSFAKTVQLRKDIEKSNLNKTKDSVSYLNNSANHIDNIKLNLQGGK